MLVLYGRCLKHELERETETETDLVTQLIIRDKLRNLNHDIEGK